MMQGDSYGLLIEIVKEADETAVKPSDIADVEITIGFLAKRYSTGEVTFDEESEKWIYPLSQEETFRLPPSRVPWQVRVQWSNGAVEGVRRGYLLNSESISKEVLL